MAGAGFFEQRQVHPTGFATVIALHAAALAAVMLIKGPVFIPEFHPPTEAFFVPPRQEPPPEPRHQTNPTRQRQTPVYVPPRPPARPNEDDHLATTATENHDRVIPTEGAGQVGPIDPPQPVHRPVRLAAQVDPRFRDALQPLYPPAEQRREHEGSVQVRIVISPEGRVVSIERLSATSDAFWEATRRQALGHWRFRPATEDGRPVEAVMTMTVTFRLTDV